MIYKQKILLFELALASVLFLIKLEYGQAWHGFDFFNNPEEPDFNCSALNLTDCAFCSPGTIFNISNSFLIYYLKNKNIYQTIWNI